MKLTVSQPQNRIKTLRQLLSGKRNATRASIVNTITGLVAYSGSAFPSQEYLGNVAGVERETINRRMPDLDGKFFHKIYRHMDTCTYHPTSEFLNNRHHFYDLIPALRQISLLWIFSITSNIYSQNVTPYKEYYRKSDKRSSAWAMKRVENAPLGFYEPRSRQDQSNSIFFLKKSSTSDQDRYLSKEKVMSELRPIVQVVKDTFGLDDIQTDYYAKYDDIILQKAIQKYMDVRKTRHIDYPSSYFKSVVASIRNSPSGLFPKTGETNKHLSKPRNPNGHSPASDAPKMTDNERIGFLVKEIASFKEKIANPEKYFLPKVNLVEALEVGRALLAAREQELADLINPPAKLGVDKDEIDMSPEEWLIWNRERKIQRIKESDGR